MIPPRRPYVMTSPSGCSTKSAAGNNSAPVVPPPTLLKLSPNSIDLGYHTMVRIFKVSMLKMPQVIYKLHCHYQNFSPLANGLYLIVITIKTLAPLRTPLLRWE